MTTTRRGFLSESALGLAAVAIVPRHVLGGPRFVAPSEKVNIALIGAGGQGRTNLRALFQEPDAQVIAVADPIEQFGPRGVLLQGAGGPQAGQGRDREALRAEDPEAPLRRVRGLPRDAGQGEGHRRGALRHARPPARLCVGHRHAARQARLLREAADAQPLGGPAGGPGGQPRPAWPRRWATQGHSRDGIRQTCEWIWDGAIGPVREVHAWVSAGRWNKTLTGLPKDTPPVPAGRELGPVARPAQAAAVPSRLYAGHVARLLGVRHRGPGRFRLPRHGRRLLGAGSARTRRASRRSPPARRMPRSPRTASFAITSSARAATSRPCDSPGTTAV